MFRLFLVAATAAALVAPAAQAAPPPYCVAAEGSGDTDAVVCVIGDSCAVQGVVLPSNPGGAKFCVPWP